ncbi:MAG: DUF1295 domain-containing protein [Propionibacteriaceae bacterium]|nr:DUF1295 domain-containing protein [Propionibacteriaceae bacterium]
MVPLKQSRAAGFALIAAVYVVATALAVALFAALAAWPVFGRVLVADLGATLAVYLVGLALGNLSVYDPYWSVAPPVIVVGLIAYDRSLTVGTILLALAITIWGVRLTANWAYTFTNLSTQDWRYDKLRSGNPRLWPLIALVGVTLFPTLVVYLCLLPAITYLAAPATTVVTVTGVVLCLAATTLQLVADTQLHRFRRQYAGEHRLIRAGLWHHSRHPNYLGEILMWWGVFVIMASATPRHWWMYAAGALVNTLMFWFVSIPLADGRNRTLRPGYDAYLRDTNALWPFWHRVRTPARDPETPAKTQQSF